jgi:cellobiose-specific phosphotransferase system component IIC
MEDTKIFLNLILFIPYIYFSMFIVWQMYTFIHY